MAPSRTTGGAVRDHFSVRLIASYLLDWIILVVIAVVGYVLSRIKPNMRSFSLADRDISFPYSKETVPDWLLFVLCAIFPIVAIFFVALIFVPGSTVPKNTPKSLVWKRKLWELHTAWLGLLMAVGSAYFFISAIKNMCGKPRPDMLDRCDPDMSNLARYRVGGFRVDGSNGQLYSAAICRQADKHILWDGFRSYPSGHAACSAAGLIYLSLFLASKFVVTIPFVVPRLGLLKSGPDVHSAFPSRLDSSSPGTSTSNASAQQGEYGDDPRVASKLLDRSARHNASMQSVRRQAAAPPVYLLVITLVPFCTSIFIAASRWFNYRHHGFDILFGYLIGIITSIYSFRYYHMPIRSGAGWAWGPRNSGRSFWAGVGRLGFGNDLSSDYADQPSSASPATNCHSNDVERYPQQTVPAQPSRPDENMIQHGEFGRQPYHDVELGRVENGVGRGV